MRNRRQGHFKRKAPGGAYSDRFGPRLGHRPDGTAAQPEPWRQDWPSFGLPALTILEDGTVLRRR